MNSQSTSGSPAFLVCHGSFNPAHRHHIEMMVSARQCLEEEGFCVIKGILAIAGANSLRKEGVEPVIDQHRLAVVSRACNDAAGPPGWLSVDGRGVHYTSVGQMLQRVLNAELLGEVPRATIFRVFGADTVERFGSNGGITRGPVVIVRRAGSSVFPSYVSGKQVFWIDELPGEFSSTKLREALQNESVDQVMKMCTPSVAEYLLANRTSLYGLKPQASNALEGNISYRSRNATDKGMCPVAATTETSVPQESDRVNGSLDGQTLGSLRCALEQSSRESKHPSNVILIGIAGPSGCGKTTLAAGLANMVNSPFLPISCDWYNGKGPIYEKSDWEKPENHDFSLLIEHLHHIRTICSTRNFPAQLHVGRLDPKNVVRQRSKHDAVKSRWDIPMIPVVVEGFLLFHNKALCDMLDVRIWLQADRGECLVRRFSRRNKDKDLDKFTKFYKSIVWPHYLKYRDTQLSHARDAVVLDSSDTTDAIAEQACAHCLAIGRRLHASGFKALADAREEEENSSHSIQSNQTLSQPPQARQRRWVRNEKTANVNACA